MPPSTLTGGAVKEDAEDQRERPQRVERMESITRRAHLFQR